MIRLAYALYRLASAARYGLPRRFTAAGILVLAGTAAAASIGMNTEASMAHQAFTLSGGFLVVAITFAVGFRGRFEVTRRLPRFASAGEPFRYTVSVRNGSARVWRDLELVEELADPRPTYAEFRELMRPASGRSTFRLVRSRKRPREFRRAALRPAPLEPLAPRGTGEAQMQVLPLRRGPLRFVAASVARRDPFGLFRGFVRVPRPETVLVLPRRYPLPDLALPGVRNYQPGGVTLASAVGASDEFVSLRDYRPGDPLRHIHWRSWAHTGRPIVKEFQDEFFVRHALVLDTFATLEQADAFEEAVSVAASFACTVGTQESLLDLLFVGPQAYCLTTGRGVGHAEQALEVLASVPRCHARPFQSLHELVLRHAPAVCGCIMILVAWDEPRRRLVRELRALGQPLLVLVIADRAAVAEITREGRRDCPEGFHVLEVGRVAEGLQEIQGMAP